MFVYKVELIIIFERIIHFVNPFKIETYMSNIKFLICREN
jgi:hypothetical protein